MLLWLLLLLNLTHPTIVGRTTGAVAEGEATARYGLLTSKSANPKPSRTTQDHPEPPPTNAPRCSFMLAVDLFCGTLARSRETRTSMKFAQPTTCGATRPQASWPVASQK
mmetsp:Transcript_7566/g.14425  ORF Transcript_7566/g.14425 Transcript_7566/m.14425 type:complete len:110 (+) Transcript_7566:112-441(+)